MSNADSPESEPKPSPESIRLAMDQAWRDHHHARDQTWKALQMVSILAVGLVSVDVNFGNAAATIAAGVLVVVGGGLGILVTKRHRNAVEIIKFTHIMNCSRALGLLKNDLITGVQIPERIVVKDIFSRKASTALFILRMHAIIIVFAVIFCAIRLIYWGSERYQEASLPAQAATSPVTR